MELSAEGLELIKTSEGFRSRKYKDVAGLPTIGYGHRIIATESFPRGVSEPQATALLLHDVREAENFVAHLVHVELTQGQFDALVDFCFNLGTGRLAESSMLRELNAGRQDAAGRQLLLWDHAGGQVFPALVQRRKAEYQLWIGAEASSRTAAAQPTLSNPANESRQPGASS